MSYTGTDATASSAQCIHVYHLRCWVCPFAGLLQCVVVCRSVSQCVTVCCSVSQCVAVFCSMLQCIHVYHLHCWVCLLAGLSRCV